MDPLHRAFCWPQVTVGVLAHALGWNLLSTSLLCRGQKATSFFSGLGTSELAWRAVGSALAAFGLACNFAFTFACEQDAACREILLKHYPEHVFNNILDFFDLPRGCCSMQGLLFLVQTVSVRRVAHCARHGRLCPIVPGRRAVIVCLRARTVSRGVSSPIFQTQCLGFDPQTGPSHLFFRRDQ